MKVCIIGTSNSVMLDGWVDGLKEHGEVEVENMSIGRTPCLMHILRIMLNQEQLLKSDLIILDHIVNDLNYYIPKIGEKYFEYIDDLMAMVSSLGIPVMNIMFPIYGLEHDQKRISQLKRIKEICEKFNIYYIDFYRYDLPKRYFEDRLHLKRGVAFFIGMELSRIVITFDYIKKKRIPYRSPYKLLTYGDLADMSNDPNNGVSSYTNSLGTFHYFTLNNRLYLGDLNGYDLVAVAYFNEAKKKHAFEVHTLQGVTRYCTSGEKFFMEILDNPIKIDESTYIQKPIKDLENIPFMMGRNEKRVGDVCGVNISYLLFRESGYASKQHINTQSSIMLDLTSRVDKSVSLLDKLFPSLLSFDEIDVIRDSSVKLESVDLNLAYGLMKIAYMLRPKGLFIQKSLNRLAKRLQKEGL